jgi:UDP-N-acetylmuramate--alanine ligase
MTSVEEDHQDFFPTYEDIRDAFVEFAYLLPKGGRLIYCSDDKGCQDVVSIVKQKRKDIRYIAYGKNAKDAGETYFYTFTNLYLESGTQNFTVQTPDFEKKLSLRVPGYHSVLNSLGAIAVCLSLWEEKGNSLNEAILDSIGKALLQFVGAKRRSEIVADIPQSPSNPYGALIIDDYAHHPTAIETTLKGFRDFYPDRLLIVSFMSHTYSRTQALIDEFASSFSAADIVFLHKIYSSARENKEKYLGNTSGEILFEKTKTHHSNVHYFDEFMDAVDPIISLIDTEPCVFITMGAGDNWKLGLAVKNRLEGKK